MSSSTADIIGREDPNDLDAILGITNTDVDEIIHDVNASVDTLFTWNYERSRPALSKLYEKAKTSQWNVTTDLDWSIEVDQQKEVGNTPGLGMAVEAGLIDLSQTPVAHWGKKEWTNFEIESSNWSLSQFLHGEQGALLCTARIVETVPWIDAKYYAATQVMDEARHVEVFGRYLYEKMSSQYPINAHLRMLLDDIVSDSRWDITYLGMQIMVEGLALAAFGFMHMLTQEPLLKKLLRYVMSDEARQVAFGVLSLQEYYQGLNQDEIRERQEFAFEAALRMRDRFLQQEVWERQGVNPVEVIKFMRESGPQGGDPFQYMLFSKIVPNCKKLGLLDAGDGWLRERFTEIGVIQFEDWADTGQEYESLDEVAKDRAAS